MVCVISSRLSQRSSQGFAEGVRSQGAFGRAYVRFFFAPSFVEMHRREGRLVETHRPLLYNYVFIRSSVYEIFRLKRDFPLYNFLPSVDGRGSYPFVSDREMENLRWVARSYSDELPVYVPEAGYLRKGDRIRITDGRFKGVEASVVIQPGVGERGGNGMRGQLDVGSFIACSAGRV